MLPVVCCLLGIAVLCSQATAQAGPARLYVYCGTGDHLWPWEREPVDSPATVDAMFDWMARTYGVTRMYWRGGQQEIWAANYQVGQTHPLSYDWTAWCNHLMREVGINATAVRAARRHHMEIYMHTGLFEHGVQPEVGIICPYPFEDRLRLEHPEWCPRDRWQQRRCPGPLSFAHPEVRRLLVTRYVEFLSKHGYDGMSFYTYVENVGIRYDNEFGFEPEVIGEFQRLHPGLDPTRDPLTEEQRLALNHCRGLFVTQFLRELHAAMQARGQRLSLLLDAKNPGIAQPWWGHTLPGTGSIEMDWETWAREGLVDELYVQLGEVPAQQALLDRLLTVCAGKPIELTFRATHPRDATWAPYVARGVTPISCITSPVNDIERYTLASTSPQTLTDRDWRLRAQTLMDVAAGRLAADASAVAATARDPHVLVRRQAVHALAALQAPDYVDRIEERLRDKESSVRIAAAVALGKLHGPHSAQRLLEAVERDHGFQLKLACVATLGALGEDGLRAVTAGLRHKQTPVREVCVRALYDLGKAGYAEPACELLRPVLRDRAEDEVVRYWAAYALVGSRLRVSAEQRRQVAADFIALVADEPSVTVQLHLAYGLGYLQESVDVAERREALDRLVRLFREYGDGSRRSDAAYGWRLVGNALHQFGPAGDEALEGMRAQREDKWLAWLAYEVLYMPQRSAKIELISEAEAVATHDKCAPPFPGYRPW